MICKNRGSSPTLSAANIINRTNTSLCIFIIGAFAISAELIFKNKDKDTGNIYLNLGTLFVNISRCFGSAAAFTQEAYSKSGLWGVAGIFRFANCFV